MTSIGSSPPDTSADIAARRVLLTGVTGFLGSRFAATLLKKGATVYGIVRPTSGLTELRRLGIHEQVHLLPIEPDLRTLDSIITDARPDVVVHTASASRVREDAAGIREMVDANVLFPSLLLESMVRHDVRCFINVGTSWQSCDGSAFRPFNYYAATKQALEDALCHFAVNCNVRAATLRLFDTYGAHDPRSKILNLIISHTLSGTKLDMSPGNQRVHLVHVSDVVDALISLISRVYAQSYATHEVFDLPSREANSLRELACLIEELAGRPCPINWGGRQYRAGEIMNPRVSNPALPGFDIKIPLREGIAEVMMAMGATLNERN